MSYYITNDRICKEIFEISPGNAKTYRLLFMPESCIMGMKNLHKEAIMKHRAPCRPAARIGLCSAAARLVIIGEILMLLAVCDFAARLNVAALAGATGALLRLSDFGSSLSASAVLLWAMALGLDYWERTGTAE